MVVEDSNADKTPFRSKEAFCGGFTIIAANILIIVAAAIGIQDLDLGSMDTESDVIDMHDKLKDERREVIIGSVLLWFTLPFMVLHLYFMNRFIGSLLYVYDIYSNYPFSYFFRKIYTMIIVVLMVVYGIVVPTFGMVCVYFDWEFTDDDGDSVYTGYYIQLALAHIAYVLHDASSFPLTIAANIPWVWYLLVNHISPALFHPLNNDEESKLNSLSENILCCRKQCGKSMCGILMLLEFIIMAVTTLICVFSLNSDGFWSYYGDSQNLNDFCILSSLLVGIWLLYVACNTDKIYQNINTIKEYQSIKDAPNANNSTQLQV